MQHFCHIFNIPVMFWRAARGRVGPNSRSVLHMAIFLLNPYGLCSCILVPKRLGSQAPLPSVGPPICQSVLDFRLAFPMLVSGKSQHVVSRAPYGPPPHIFGTRFAGSQARLRAPRAGAVYANRCWHQKKCGCLTFIKKYDIIFKKRVCVRRWRLGSLTILKKYDIINKKTSTADRS